jgi:hypothetical protein
MRHAVVGVLGGSGGVGASTFAAALAAAARPGVLCDLDPLGGGADVLLEIDEAAGARWSGLHLGGGRLAPRVLAEGLPRWGDVPVLALDSAAAPTAGAALQVLDAATELGTVAVDLGRASTPARAAVIGRCALVVVVVRAAVAPLAAAHAITAALDAPLGAVVRPGYVPADRAAHLIGATLLGALPDVATPIRGGKLARRLSRVAAAVLDGLPADVPVAA